MGFGVEGSGSRVQGLWFMVLHVSGVLMDGEVGCHEVEVLGDVDVSLVHGGRFRV